MIYVVATIRIAAGQRETFLSEFRRVVPLVRNEEGCIEYSPTLPVETNLAASSEQDGDDVVVVVEKWISLEALERHLTAPHMVEYRAKVKEVVQSVDLKVLKSA